MEPAAVAALFAGVLAAQASGRRSTMTAGMEALDRRDFAKPETHLRAGLNGPQSRPEQPAALSRLSLLGERQDQYAEVPGLCPRSLELREAEHGRRRPEAATALEHQASGLRKAGRGAEADKRLARARAIRAARIQADSADPPPAEIAAVKDAARAVRLIRPVNPECADEARLVRQQEAAELSAAAGLNGRAPRLRLVRALGFGLDEKAVEALRQERFKPGKGGRPAAGRAGVTVPFRLL